MLHPAFLVSALPMTILLFFLFFIVLYGVVGSRDRTETSAPQRLEGGWNLFWGGFLLCIRTKAIWKDKKQEQDLVELYQGEG